MQAAVEGVQDRLARTTISRSSMRAAAAIGSFTADERRLRQILFNLLSNAVGFSPPGETVALTAERRPDAVVFTVTDHGPGIPPEAKDRVFEWFETDSQGSQHRGTGLGLSLVRSFVHLHGGTVTIDFGGRPRHHHHLHISGWPAGRTERGLAAAQKTPAAPRRRSVSCVFVQR